MLAAPAESCPVSRPTAGWGGRGPLARSSRRTPWLRRPMCCCCRRAPGVAAQVSDEQPFGVPAQPSSRRSPLRHGFTWTIGALLALTVGLAARTVEHQLLLIVLAAFIAIGLDPAVAFLVGKGLRRAFAVTVIALLALACVAGFVAAAAPPLAKQASQLASQAPTYLQQLNDHSTVLGRLNNQFHLVDKLKAQASGGASLAAGGVLHAGTVLISATFETVIVLVLVIYFLADLAKIKHACYRLFPRHRRPRVGLLGDAILARVGGYVLGNVLTSIVAIIGNYIVLLALHVPYALALSILVGVLDLIPLVGSTIGGVIVALVALAEVSTTAALITVAYHVLYRVFEDYLLNPRVLRKTVDVSPAGHRHRRPARRRTARRHRRPDRRAGRRRLPAPAHRSALPATRHRPRTHLRSPTNPTHPHPAPGLTQARRTSHTCHHQPAKANQSAAAPLEPPGSEGEAHERYRQGQGQRPRTRRESQGERRGRHRQRRPQSRRPKRPGPRQHQASRRESQRRLQVDPAHPAPDLQPGPDRAAGQLVSSTGFDGGFQLPLSRLLGEGVASVLDLELDRGDEADLAV